MSFPPPRESGTNWSGAGQAGSGQTRYPTATVPLSRLTNSGTPASGYAAGYTSQAFPVVSLPSSPNYPSSTSSRGLPPRRVLESIARRSRPRWGLRFMFVLILVGTGAYFLRKWLPPLDERITKVETTVRELGRQYGFLDGSPAPLPRPTGTLTGAADLPPADPAAGVALARAGAGKAVTGTGRPDIQPLPGKPTAPAAAAPAAPARPGFAPAAPGRAVRGYGRHRGGLASATPHGRFRRRLAAGRAAAAAANAETAALNALASKPAAGAPAAAKAEAAAAPEKPAPSEAVKAAAGSGDELDQLMASAVGPAPKAGSDLDKKLSTVQKGEAGVKAAKPEAKQALGRSEIQTVMKDVQSQMGDCLKKTGQGGPVDVKVTVAPDGDVKSTVIKGDMAGTPTGACVDAKLKATVFPPSGGQTFDYRLVVR